jgi:amidophosphoribosyltransferase
MGVDMASRDELIAAQKSVEEIREHIGADSLAYLSIDALMRGLEADDGYCNACFTGSYPFESERFVQLQLKTKEQFAQVWGD